MDAARLDLLVRDSWPRLVPLAYLLTGAPDAANELVQSAVRRRADVLPTGAALRDAVVREAFRQRRLYPAGAAPFAEQGGGEPMRAVLRQLPLDERAVLVLRFREGLDPAQVKEVLRVPSQGLEKREKRALTALRGAGMVAGEPQPAELRALLEAVVEAAALPGPPDAAALQTEPARRGWFRRA